MRPFEETRGGEKSRLCFFGPNFADRGGGGGGEEEAEEDEPFVLTVFVMLI